MDDDLYLRPADLHNEDGDGLGWTIVELPDFQPGRVFPGALLPAGRPGAETLVTVVRTELFETADGRTVVLVSFRKDHFRRPRTVRVVVEGSRHQLSAVSPRTSRRDGRSTRLPRPARKQGAGAVPMPAAPGRSRFMKDYEAVGGL